MTASASASASAAGAMARKGADEDAGGEHSELIDIVLYMFVLGPAIEWCLKSPWVNRGRPGSRRGILLAIALLATIAGCKLAWEIAEREVNHFTTLGVRVDASKREIQKAYQVQPRSRPLTTRAHTARARPEPTTSQ